MSNRRRMSLKQNKTKKNIKSQQIYQRGGDDEPIKITPEMEKAVEEKQMAARAAEREKYTTDVKKKRELKEATARQERDNRTAAAKKMQENRAAAKNMQSEAERQMRLKIKIAQQDVDEKTAELQTAKTKYEKFKSTGSSSSRLGFKTSAEKKAEKTFLDAQKTLNESNEILTKLKHDNSISARFMSESNARIAADAAANAPSNAMSDNSGASPSFKSRIGAAGTNFANKAKSMVGYKPNSEQTSMISSLAKTVSKMGAKEATKYTNNFLKKYPELGQFVKDNDIVNRATDVKNKTMKFAQNFKAHASTAKDMERAKLKHLARREEGKEIPSFFKNMKRAASIGTQFTSNITGNVLTEIGDYLGVDPNIPVEDAVMDRLQRGSEIAIGTMKAMNSDQGKADVERIKETSQLVNDNIIKPVVDKTAKAISDGGEKIGTALGKTVSSFVSATPLGIPINAMKTVVDSTEAAGQMFTTAGEIAGVVAKTKDSLDNENSSVIGDFKDSVNSLMDQALDEIDKENPEVKKRKDAAKLAKEKREVDEIAEAKQAMKSEAEAAAKKVADEADAYKQANPIKAQIGNAMGLIKTGASNIYNKATGSQQGGGFDMHKIMQMHNDGSMVARRIVKTQKSFFAPLSRHKTRRHRTS